MTTTFALRAARASLAGVFFAAAGGCLAETVDVFFASFALPEAGFDALEEAATIAGGFFGFLSPVCFALVALFAVLAL